MPGLLLPAFAASARSGATVPAALAAGWNPGPARALGAPLSSCCLSPQLGVARAPPRQRRWTEGPASQRRARWWSLFWVCVLVFVATPCLSGLVASEPLARHTSFERLAFHSLRGLAALALLAGWGLALWGVPRWLRNQKNRVEEGSAIDAVSRPLAKRRMKELGCDWLYRPEEWRQLGRKPQA